MTESDELYEAFYQDTAPLVAQVRERLLAIERSVEALIDDWQHVLGCLHTIKGNSGMMQIPAGERLAHAMERRAAEARRAPAEQQVRTLGSLLTSAAGLEDAISIEPDEGAVDALVRDLEAGEASAEQHPEAARAAADKAIALAGASRRVPYMRIEAEVLDRLLELVGELVTCVSRAEATRAIAPGKTSPSGGDRSADDLVELLGKHVGELRRRVLDARLVPMQLVVGRFKRLVRDLSTVTGKKLSLTVEGADTVVDKNIADHIGEPLLHLIRNAADHGIEDADARREAGKTETGRIELRIAPAGGDLVVEVRDDGAGLSRARLEQAAAQRGIDTTGWTDRQVHELVFRSEFSTTERVTRLSGRGVGMPQVKRTVEEMGGDLQLSTTPGRGTTFRVRVPLTAAVQRALIAECADEVYAVPVRAVAEAFRVAPSDLHPVERGWVTPWRGRVLPAQYLPRHLDAGVAAPERESLVCVVIEDDDRRLGLLVDDVSGQQEVMVRNLDSAFGRPAGIAGVTMVGEGRIAIALDPRSIPSLPPVETAPGLDQGAP